MSMVQLTASDFDKEVLQADKPVLVDFYADWCMPCKVLGPVIEEIASERSDIKVCKLNVDDAQELAGSYGVMSIPTVILFKGGEKKDQFIGARAKDDIISFVDKNSN